MRKHKDKDEPKRRVIMTKKTIGTMSTQYGGTDTINEDGDAGSELDGNRNGKG